MKLYKLISRHGQFKKRMYPWFEAPAAAAPRKYDGWLWDPAKREWIETDVAEITIEYEVPEYPMPTEPPRPAQPLYMSGWYWNGRAGRWEEETMPFQEVWVTPERPPMPAQVPSRAQPAVILGWRYSFEKKEWQDVEMEKVPEMREMARGSKPKFPPGPAISTKVPGWTWYEVEQEWVATIYAERYVEFEPPRSLPPDVTQEAVFELFSWEQLFLEEINAFVAQGYTYEAAKRITRENFDPLLRVLWAKQSEETVKGWQDLVAKISGHPKIEIQEIAVYGVVILLTAVVGLVIGDILRRLAFYDAEDYFLFAPPNTYLLGPENWDYSKNIGKSIGGKTYYSHCGSIGDAYTRHKRAVVGGGYDVIDFPGGFIETGFQFPYWVKYTWDYWRIQYIGMLSSCGERFYQLKEGDYDRYATVPAGHSVKQSEWCTDFHYYLRGVVL